MGISRIHNAKISTFCANLLSFPPAHISILALSVPQSIIASQIHCHSFICPARQLFIRLCVFFPLLIAPALISQINFNLTQFQQSYFTMPFGLIQNALMLVRSYICPLVCSLARSLALSLISFTSPLNISIVTILMTKHFARSEQLKQLNRQAYSHARTHRRTYTHL